MLPADVASEPDGITLEMCCKGDIRVIEVPDRTARSLALGFVKGFADLDDTRYVDATRTTYDAFLLTDPEHPGIKRELCDPSEIEDGTVLTVVLHRLAYKFKANLGRKSEAISIVQAASFKSLINPDEKVVVKPKPQLFMRNYGLGGIAGFDNLYERAPKWKKDLIRFLEFPQSSLPALLFAICTVSAILLSATSVVVQTLPQLVYLQGTSSGNPFFIIETTCVCIFIVELAMRYVAALSKRSFFQSIFTWVDLIAILPYFVDLVIESIDGHRKGATALTVVRMLRLVRVTRLIKVLKDPIQLFINTIKASSMAIQLLFFLVVISLVFMSSVIYFAERGEYNLLIGTWERITGYNCPKTVYLKTAAELTAALNSYTPAGRPCMIESQSVINDPNSPRNGWIAFQLLCLRSSKESDACVPIRGYSPFQSIPASMYYTLVTMGTIGYGDLVPVTALGKFFGAIIVLFGVLTIALPASVIGTNFANEYQIYVQQMEATKHIRGSLHRLLGQLGARLTPAPSLPLKQTASNAQSCKDDLPDDGLSIKLGLTKASNVGSQQPAPNSLLRPGATINEEHAEDVNAPSTNPLARLNPTGPAAPSSRPTSLMGGRERSGNGHGSVAGGGHGPGSAHGHTPPPRARSPGHHRGASIGHLPASAYMGLGDWGNT